MPVINSVLQHLQESEQRFLRRTRYPLNQRTGAAISFQDNALLNFASNDYLGLSMHPYLQEVMINTVREIGIGSGSAQVVSGYFKQHQTLEEKVADFTGRERALIFSTGYLANLGMIGGLVHKNDGLLLDKNNHASIIDAARLSDASFKRYLHCQPHSLARCLQSLLPQRKFIVTEGVFSMEGDIAPLPEIVKLAKQYQACLMVDDAHGLGVLGSSGQGTLSHFNLTQQDVPLLAASFGKACGSLGAFVAGDATLIESIVQFSRSFICSTAMPPPLAAVNHAALHLLQTENLTEQLQSVIHYFIKSSQQLKLNFLPSLTAIQPLVVGSAEKALYLHQLLLSKGFLVGVMRPPTVPPNTARLRISLSIHHTKHEIDRLLDFLHTQCQPIINQ